MIGDILNIEHHHIEKALYISKIIVEYNKSPIIVVIEGFSGSGKSEIVQEIHRYLYKQGTKSFSISNDDYYLTTPNERNKKRAETGIIGHKELNWDKINKIAKAFREQSTAYIQEYHLYSDKFLHTEFNFSGIDVFIFEGLFAGYLSKKDISFFLDANYSQTYRFRKTRGKENPDDKFRKQVLKIEAEEIKKQKDKANYIIPYTFA